MIRYRQVSTLMPLDLDRGSRAVGVEYSLHDRFHHSAQKQILVVRATKCVVLSVGALGTPQILERSRVGQQAVLEALNITQRVELAGVGENYQGMSTFPSLHARELIEY